MRIRWNSVRPLDGAAADATPRAAAATSDGDVVTYADIYGRDAPIRTALNRSAVPATQQASAN